MMIKMLMILAREHNRVAAELAKMHPAWNDDKLYSEVMHMVHVVVIVSYISTPRGTRIHFLLVSFRISSHPEFALQHLLIRLVQLSSPRCNTSLTGLVNQGHHRYPELSLYHRYPQLLSAFRCYFFMTFY